MIVRQRRLRNSIVGLTLGFTVLVLSSVASAEVGVGDDAGTWVRLSASVPASVPIARGLSFKVGAASKANGAHVLPYRGTVSLGVEYLKTRKMLGGKPLVKVIVAGTAEAPSSVRVPLSSSDLAKLRALATKAHRKDVLVRIDFEFPLVNLNYPTTLVPSSPWKICTAQVWARLPIS